jgi:CRISPR-associated endonuclease/helicase Cas3
MMVTFVSQCEKNALLKSRRVLDSFANRIGTNVWQTLITEEGLNVVKKLLRQTATKNTAVSCHRIRGYNRSELVWIVGNRSKFNAQGFVPVHTTKQAIINTNYENDWQYLPLIKSLTALSALFHDWGKASACFQDKLQPSKAKKIISDPLRHEWVSCLLLHAFVNGAKTDSEWLSLLAAGEINETEITKNLSTIKNPLKNLPPLASLIAWLVLSHHRLPLPQDEEKRKKSKYQTIEQNNFSFLLSWITADFGYQNADKTEKCLDFPNGLPHQSQQWLKDAKKWATKTQNCEALAKSAIENDVWRLVLHHARLSLMLGDHYFSSQKEVNEKWQSDFKPIANTFRDTGKPKQKLDEHLVGVAENALKTAYLLPQFETTLPFAKDIRRLKKKSPEPFDWQDIAVTKIKAWRESEATQQLAQFGFFTVNMASTGKGKTFANAKIMRALSPDSESLRYILALGLRTLTLQTGDEYRNRIGLGDDELAVLIGSKAIMELHEQNQKETKEKELNEAEKNGSESDEELLDGDIEYDCKIPEEGLATVLRIEKDRQFLYAPVLACTVDHLMAATETKRGGKYILPSLRLMSSDLVIDEIDDFDGDDLVAIGRLIHLAGMLGRKVMISSATIPPDLAEGYFNAYQAGWQIFSASREVKKTVGCAWIDEFSTQTESITAKENSHVEFKEAHAKFIKKRVKELLSDEKKTLKRKGEIISLESLKDDSDSNEENKTAGYFEIVAKSIVEQHSRHFKTDDKTGKSVSFGVVRIANIPPCVELAKFLIQREWENDVDVKIMAYHSQQVMLMRNAQEKHLDEILNRKNPDVVFENTIIREHLTQSSAQNVIFIVVATPVEEVGRDHDFDFAIVEPSSYRSIIQLAGRVLRHRDKDLTQPNITLLQYNLNGLLRSEEKAVFCHPGYESSDINKNDYQLKTHDLKKLIDETAITQSINAIPRIQRKQQLDYQTNLADLEHHVIHQLLTAYEKKGAANLEGWLSSCWFLTALPQVLTPFRQGEKQMKLYLISDDDGESWHFVEKNDKGKTEKCETTRRIEKRELDEKFSNRLWLHRDYAELVEAAKKLMSIRDATLRYGEISLPEDRPNGFVYFEQFGMIAKKHGK